MLPLDRCIIGMKIPKSSVIHKCIESLFIHGSMSVFFGLSWQIELHCYWCVLSLQDSLLYFWLGLVRLLSNWKKYMWGRKLQEEFGCVFNCHLSGALVPFVMVPEKRVLGALVEELLLLWMTFPTAWCKKLWEWSAQWIFPLPRKSEQSPRTSECLTSVVYSMWWCFAPNVILLPIRCAWNWASMNLSFIPKWQQIGYGYYWQVNGLRDLNMTKQTKLPSSVPKIVWIVSC
jgi:hypothetical protein